MLDYLFAVTHRGFGIAELAILLFFAIWAFRTRSRTGWVYLVAVAGVLFGMVGGWSWTDDGRAPAWTLRHSGAFAAELQHQRVGLPGGLKAVTCWPVRRSGEGDSLYDYSCDAQAADGGGSFHVGIKREAASDPALFDRVGLAHLNFRLSLSATNEVEVLARVNTSWTSTEEAANAASVALAAVQTQFEKANADGVKAARSDAEWEKEQHANRATWND